MYFNQFLTQFLWSSLVLFLFSSETRNFFLIIISKTFLASKFTAIRGTTLWTLHHVFPSREELMIKTHPSIHFLYLLNPLVGSWGGLEPIPAVLGWEAGYTLDRSLVHHRATQRQATTHTRSHSLLRTI